MLQGPLAPFLLAASVAVVAAVPPPKQCETEMNKIKDVLQVSCVDQGLTSVPTGLPEATGILLLASNRLPKVALASFQHLPQLSELDLSNNSLRALETGADLPKLEQLILSHNGLESLPAFPGLPSLKRLALGHNELSQLPEGGFRSLGRLVELELQGNRLQSLPGRAFEGLEVLRDLDLSDNRLESLPPELLGELPELNILRLERNRLERLPGGFFSEEAVYVYVYLVGNPWLCDCRLVYLRDWITENEHAVYTRTTVQEKGFDKEVTDNEPHRVLCQAPPEEKGRPVMSFQVACSKPGDDDQQGEEEGEPVGDSQTPPTPSPGTPRPSSHRPSTAISPTGAALTPTTSTSALSASTTHSRTTSSPGPTTTLHVPTTTAAVVTTTSSPGPTTTLHVPTTTAAVVTTTSSPGPTTTLHVLTTAPVVAFGLSTSRATAGRSTPTSLVATMTPGTSIAHLPPTRPPSVPTTTATSRTPLALSPTASMLPTSPLAPSAPTTTAAGHLPSPVAPTSPTHVKSSPRSPAPLSPRDFSPPPAPKPSAHCLCPALPVRVLGVAARKGSRAGWLAGWCCLLRLGLYLACLVLVALPTLVLLCRLGCLHVGWFRPALRGAPGSRLARPQEWPKASPEDWRVEFAEAPRPTPAPRVYRVCKRFQVAPSRHVTWLLVSLPGSAGKWAQMQARLSSYSLDRGRDTLGAVRVKYAAASL